MWVTVGSAALAATRAARSAAGVSPSSRRATSSAQRLRQRELAGRVELAAATLERPSKLERIEGFPPATS